MDTAIRSANVSENTHKIIYISDLPKTTSYLDLSEFYERHVGPCMICIKRPLFKSFYYAFVQFDSIENAKKAAADFRFPVIKGGHMSRVLPYNMHALRGEPGGRDMQSTSVFVKGFEKAKWNHADLYAKFCTFGKIISCKVSQSPDHQFLGYGYVQYSKLEEAQKAIQEMDNYDLSSDGPQASEGILSVLEYQGKRNQGRPSFNNVYVKNFPKEFSDQDLADLFCPFGKIQNVVIMRGGNGESKGFGFVCFAESAAAEKVIQVAQQVEGGKKSTDFQIDLTLEVKGVKVTDLYVREAKKKS
jgi:polyadenylate-binding protein